MRAGGGFRGGGGRGGGRRSDIRLKHDIVFLGRLDNGLLKNALAADQQPSESIGSDEKFGDDACAAATIDQAASSPRAAPPAPPPIGATAPPGHTKQWEGGLSFYDLEFFYVKSDCCGFLIKCIEGRSERQKRRDALNDLPDMPPLNGNHAMLLSSSQVQPFLIASVVAEIGTRKSTMRLDGNDYHIKASSLNCSCNSR